MNLEFINSEVEKYYQYLQNYDELYPRQKSGPKVGYKRKPRIEDIRIEDIEDKNLNKLLDKNKDSILD